MPNPMITGPEVEGYLYGILPSRSAVLQEMEQQAAERKIPIVGPAVARLFQLLAEISGARRIFELGSAIGYSTLWWAQAAGEGGEVYYTDSDPAKASEAREYFRRAGMESRIHILVGDALEMLDRTPGEFDVVFCDLDKPAYPEALRRALPRIRKGGLLVADNVLWSGRVAMSVPSHEREAETQAIAAFNREIYAEPTLFPVMLPLRDGVAVCRKMR